MVFASSDALTKMSSDLIIGSEAVMTRRPGKAVSATGREPPESARPMAPEIFMEPLKMRVYCRPITRHDRSRRREEVLLRLPITSTNLGSIGKRRKCLISSVRVTSVCTSAFPNRIL